MKKVKGFRYDVNKDYDVIQHIEKQSNQSWYIWDLVRKDINKKEHDIESLVKKYVEQYCESLNFKQGIKNDTPDIGIDIDDVLSLLKI